MMGRAVAHLWFILVVGVAGAGLAVAQTGTVAGRVFDPSLDVPVEYANVVLYGAADSVQVTGTVTDAAGAFELPGVGPGDYYLEVSFIGFASRRVADVSVAPGARLDLGRLALAPAPLAVEGAEVVGEKPAVRFELDKKVIEVSKLPGAASGTAVDALENAPSVSVDIEGNVSLRGSRNFKVLIDGKPTMLEPSDALRQLPTSTIERIEIITNPSAKFDPDGAAGIINVIMKKQKMSGLSALANANGSPTGTFGGDLLLGLKQGIVSAHAGGDFNRRRFLNTAESELRTFGAGETTVVSTSGDGSWDARFGGGRAGVEVAEGERDRSSLSGMLRLIDLDSRDDNTYERFWLPADTGRSEVAAGWWRRKATYLFLSADHSHDFDTAGHRLLVQGWLGSYAADDDAGFELSDSGGVTTSGRRDLGGGPTFWSQAEAEYTLPLREKDKFEAGYELQVEGADEDTRQQSWDPFEQQYVTDSAGMHLVHGRRLINSLYATYAWNWRALGVQAGARGEYGSRLVELAGENRQWDVRRWDAFPTAHVSVGLPAGQQLTASYTRRIERPDPWSLQPYESWSGPTSVRVGDPELLPERVDSWEAGWQLPFGGNSLSAEAYWRVTGNSFENFGSPYPGRPGVILSRSINAGTSRSAGGELSANLRLVPWWGLDLSFDLYDRRSEGEYAGQSFVGHSFNYDGQFSTDVTLPTQTRLQFNGFWSSPSATIQGRQAGYLVASAAVRQSLFNRALVITLRVRDLFDTGRWSSTSEGPGFESSSSYFGQSRVVSLAVTWNFNNFRMTPKMREGEGMEPTGPQR